MAAAGAPKARFVIGSLADAADHDAIARGLGGPTRRRRAAGGGQHGRLSPLGQIKLIGVEIGVHHELAREVYVRHAARSPDRDDRTISGASNGQLDPGLSTWTL